MLVLQLNLLLGVLASAKCFDPSIAHRPPIYDPYDPLLQAAFASIDTALTIAVAASEYASVSFSIEVTSSEESLWSQHHTARERNASRPDIPRVNANALYRIASITKTFTVLGILQQHKAGNLSLDDTIDQYIEELGEKQTGSLPWKDITLRSLASQLSGIPREFAQGDLINAIDPNDLGLPPVSRAGFIKCDEYTDFKTPCTARDLLDALKSQVPIFAPNQKSTYSNTAFELLGLVLARITNQTYEAYIGANIFDPLNMTLSTLATPPDSAGVIPTNPHYWGVDEGIQNPTGGIYSSTHDLSKFLRYILTHFNGITHALNWIHPVSPSTGLHSFYGLPWEIFQTDRILDDSQRTVRFITKSGGLPGYTSIIMTIPEYNLGISILLAGPPTFFGRLREIVTVAIVRAAEALAVRQLGERYAGTYTATAAGLNSSITLVADTRGLIVEKWISNGTDVLKNRIVDSFFPEHRFAQLVPTLLYHDAEEQKGEEWRILVVEERQQGVGAIWDDFCITDVDFLVYGGLPFNEVVFWAPEGKKGSFGRLELPAFRVNLTKGGNEDGREEQAVFEL